MLALVLLLVSFPFIEGSLTTDLLLNLFQALIVMAAVTLVSKDRRLFSLTVVLGAMSLVSGWVPRQQEPPLLHFIGSVGGIGYQSLAVGVIVRHVMKDQAVTYNLLCGSFCSYLLIGFLWTDIYDIIEYVHPFALMSLRNPHVRQGWTDFLYFSFTTLTEIGNSEIVPASPVARSAMIFECIVGIFFITVVVSRLVSLQIAAAPPSNGAGTAEGSVPTES